MRTAFWSLFVSATLAAGVVNAEGFSGQGHPADWSEALPYYNLGNKYLSSQRWQDAVQKYEEAIARYKYDPDFYVNLGMARRQLADFTGAEAAFKAAIALNDKDWMAWSNLANAYLKQDRLEDCLKAFEETLKRQPPAQEVQAIKTDMVMLKKFIGMRKPAAAPAARSSKPASSAASPGKQTSGAVRQNADTAARTQADVGTSGWDYVYR